MTPQIDMLVANHNQTSLRWQKPVAAFLCAVFLGVGAFLSWTQPADPLALAPMLLSILAATPLAATPWRRTVPLLVTALATIFWVLPTVLNGHVPDYTQLALGACLWAAVASLIWETNRAELNIHAFNKALLDSPIGLLIADTRGEILTCNETMARMCGKDSGTDLGPTIADLAGAEFWQLIQDQQEILVRGDPLEIEFDLQVDEDLRFLAGHAKLACDARGRGRYYIIQVEDLTERQSTQLALQNATQQIRRVLSQSSDIVFITNHRFVVAFANEAAMRTLKPHNPHLVGHSIYKTVASDDKQRFTDAAATFADPGRRESRIERMALDGAPPLPVAARIIRLGNGQAPDPAPSFAIVCKPLADDNARALSQDRFSQVFHASPDAILILRAADQVVVDFNEGFTRLLGYAREDAIGVSGLEAHFWSNPVERDAVIAGLKSYREVIDYETTLTSKSGAIVHVSISLRYIEIDSELCILCNGRDITQRISAEAALVETEEKFEKVFTQSPDGIVILRQSDGHITDLNEAFQARTGYTRAELLGQNFRRFFPVFDAAELSDANAELMRDGVVNNREVTLTTKTDEAVPYLISATLLELGGEGYAMVIAKDISKQRATEQRLRRSEQRFRGIFENAPIGILLIDLQGRIFQVNHTAATLLEYGQQEMYGTHISRLVPPDGRTNLRDSLSQLATSKSSVSKAERRLVRQSGLELWSSFQIVLQRNSANQPLYYIVQIADISDIKQSQERMEQMAFYDTLTNLANRRLFQDRLNRTIEQCQRHERSAALLYLDLDNFKRVNDTLGHHTGDNLLREVASRLQSCVRQEDTVGRTGGDEFTILLNEIVSPADAGQVAQKILNHLREPIQVSGHPLVVTTSIGIAILPGDGEEPGVIMSNADLAMYKAKERGRNNFQFYSEDLNTDAVRRLQTEYQIRQALDKNEFELYFQPKVCLRSQRVVGAECLIRWNHPERGLLGPDEFVGIAEETGSIIDIGSWIIEDACRSAGIVTARHNEPFALAINISPRQFKDPNLVNTVRRGLREQQLSAHAIEIEITETMLMQNAEAAQATVQRLSELGVRLAIDDFGTGYSSLNYLKRFPIDVLKVDRSFVKDLPGNADDMAITRAVIAMAHQLNMEVVAEGVENQAQLAFLARQKCEYAQGYLFSKPLPLEGMLELLAAQSPATAQSKLA